MITRGFGRTKPAMIVATTTSNMKEVLAQTLSSIPDTRVTSATLPKMTSSSLAEKINLEKELRNILD